MFSRMNYNESPWSGCVRAMHASESEEKDNELLSVSEARYKESSVYKFEDYFDVDLLGELKGKDVLEIGSNYGGMALYFYETFNLNSYTGIEISYEHIRISNLFFLKKKARDGYCFVEAYAEKLPLKSDSYDAILTFDVFEHVKSVEDVLLECYRVLRKGGKAYIVFPSYYHPTAHHLYAVTSAPIIHWFYSSKTLYKVYCDILKENPDYMKYKNIEMRNMERWEKLPGINGITMGGFKKIIKKQPWEKAVHSPVLLGSLGKVSERYTILKSLCKLLYVGLRIPVLREFSNHRIVFILQK